MAWATVSGPSILMPLSEPVFLASVGVGSLRQGPSFKRLKRVCDCPRRLAVDIDAVLFKQPHSFHSQPTAEHNIDSFLRDDFSWRHAAAMMGGAPSRVRLIILVSDGFPNDLGYKAEYATADTRKAVQEARLRRARDAEQLARLTAEQKVLDAVLEQARAADAARRRCQSQRDAIRVTAESLDALRSAEHRRVLAEVRLRTAATRVEYRLQPGASVRLAGQPIHGEDSVLVTEASALEVDAIGSFTIHPGGEDLDRLRAQLQAHARTLEHQLGELGVADIGAAESAFKARQAFENEAKEHQARLSGLAPHGLSALEERAASLDSQRQALLVTQR